MCSENLKNKTRKQNSVTESTPSLDSQHSYHNSFHSRINPCYARIFISKKLINKKLVLYTIRLKSSVKYSIVIPINSISIRASEYICRENSILMIEIHKNNSNQVNSFLHLQLLSIILI